MGDEWTVSNNHTKKSFIKFIDTMDFSRSIKFTWKLAGAKRSNSANGLYWVWMDELAKKFSHIENANEKDKMHLLMKYKFLGTETVVIGSTEIKDQVRSTKKMSKNDFCEYMMKVDIWAQGNGILLPRPEDNLYSQYYEAAA